MSIIAPERTELAVPSLDLWELHIGESRCGGRYYPTAAKAATGIVKLAEQRHQQGRHTNFRVVLTDKDDEVLVNATSDVADVLEATGWPSTPQCSADDVASLLGAILLAP